MTIVVDATKSQPHATRRAASEIFYIGLLCYGNLIHI
jgi:hypothetical protein